MAGANQQRLLLPLLTVGAALFVLELVVPGTHRKPDSSEFWRVYAFPYEHLWFLQAIFLVFVAVGLLDALRLLSTKPRALLAVVVSAVMLIVIPVPEPADVFSIGGALHLLPFCLNGYVLNRHRALSDSQWVLVLAPAFFLLYSVRFTTMLDVWHPIEPLDRTIGRCVGVVGIVALSGAQRDSLEAHGLDRWIRVRDLLASCIRHGRRSASRRTFRPDDRSHRVRDQPRRGSGGPDCFQVSAAGSGVV